MNIADLKPDQRNARKHNPRNIGMIASALQEVGAARSIVIDEDNNILAGNGTIEAAAQVGIDRIKVVEADGNEIVAVKRTGLSKRDKKRLALYDNRTAELADWEPQILSEDKDILDGLFSTQELNDILAGLEVEQKDDPGAQLDRAAELQVKWQTERGQLWSVGKHRLLCGDSTNADDVARLMGGQRAAIMTTDPPYGVDYGELVASRKNQKKGGWDAIQNDALDDDALLSLLTTSLQGAGATVAFVWHPPGARRFLFWQALEANGWRVAQEIVWVKNALVFGRADYQWRHEPCMYAKRPGARAQDDRTQTTVWELNKPTDSQHPTQKPVELFSLPLQNHTDPGDIAYDPFLGSGTTMVAAEQTGRVCYGMEIEPKYVAVALERMAGMGLEPQLLDAQK